DHHHGHPTRAGAGYFHLTPEPGLDHGTSLAVSAAGCHARSEAHDCSVPGGARGMLAARATMSDAPVDRRWLVYTVLDALFAVAYVAIAQLWVRSADGSFELASLVAGGAAAVAAVGTAARRPWGWWLAVAGCGAVLLFAIAVLALLAMSAAFLSGV